MRHENRWETQPDDVLHCDTRLKLGAFFQIVPGFDLPSVAVRFGFRRRTGHETQVRAHANAKPMSEVCSIQRLID